MQSPRHCNPLGTVFSGKVLGNFTELYLFTKVNSLVVSAFINTTIGILIIPSHISSLGSSSLGFTKAQLVDLPATITSIPNYSRNTSVWIIRAINPPSIANYSPMNGEIYVPDDSVGAYKAATGWTRFAAKIHPISEYDV